MDVTQAANIEEALKQAEAGFGPIHGVVNNAGVTATRPALEQDDWFICAAYRWDEDKREPRQLIPCRNGSLERSRNS